MIVIRRPAARVGLVVVALAGLAPLAAPAATIEAKSARVVEFRDIPVFAEPDSLRVAAKGVPAVLGAVAIRERADSPKETPEQLALRDDVKRIEGELAKIGSQDRVAAVDDLIAKKLNELGDQDRARRSSTPGRRARSRSGCRTSWPARRGPLRIGRRSMRERERSRSFRSGKTTTPNSTASKTRPGVMLWKLTLAPHEKKDVVLAYTVRYPKDLFVPGLE